MGSKFMIGSNLLGQTHRANIDFIGPTSWPCCWSIRRPSVWPSWRTRILDRNKTVLQLEHVSLFTAGEGGLICLWEWMGRRVDKKYWGVGRALCTRQGCVQKGHVRRIERWRWLDRAPYVIYDMCFSSKKGTPKSEGFERWFWKVFWPPPAFCSFLPPKHFLAPFSPHFRQLLGEEPDFWVFRKIKTA